MTHDSTIVEELENAPIKRTTAHEISEAYQTACSEIKQAIALLQNAKARVDAACDSREGNCIRHSTERIIFDVAAGMDSVQNRLRRHVWRVILDKVQARNFLSIADAHTLDEELYPTKMDDAQRGTLPEVSEETIYSLLAGFMQSVPEYTEKAIAEVFEMLRPPRSEYKTNPKYEIGKRVILSWMCEFRFDFCVEYSREQRLRALDNVFHLLDGKWPIKTYGGPLLDALKTPEAKQTGIAQTEYFTVQMHRNRNMHITFRRADLVKELNRRGGGATLRDDRTA